MIIQFIIQYIGYIGYRYVREIIRLNQSIVNLF